MDITDQMIRTPWIQQSLCFQYANYKIYTIQSIRKA